MPKKCPPGVICIENVTLLIVTIVLGIIAYFVYVFNTSMKTNNEVGTSKLNGVTHELSIPIPTTNISEHHVSNREITAHVDRTRPYLDPYAPPLKPTDTMFHTEAQMPKMAVPINVPTQGPIPEYRQVGILTRNEMKDTILPLFGRPLYSNRDKWQYYTMNDKSHAIKLPISQNGKSCTSETGCNSLYNGDNVYVEGYNDVFNVTVYENNAIQYIPIV